MYIYIYNWIEHDKATCFLLYMWMCCWYNIKTSTLQCIFQYSWFICNEPSVLLIWFNCFTTVTTFYFFGWQSYPPSCVQMNNKSNLWLDQQWPFGSISDFQATCTIFGRNTISTETSQIWAHVTRQLVATDPIPSLASW